MLWLAGDARLFAWRPYELFAPRRPGRKQELKKPNTQTARTLSCPVACRDPGQGPPPQVLQVRGRLLCQADRAHFPCRRRQAQGLDVAQRLAVAVCASVYASGRMAAAARLGSCLWEAFVIILKFVVQYNFLQPAGRVGGWVVVVVCSHQARLQTSNIQIHKQKKKSKYPTRHSFPRRPGMATGGLSAYLCVKRDLAGAMSSPSLIWVAMAPALAARGVASGATQLFS